MFPIPDPAPPPVLKRYLPALTSRWNIMEKCVLFCSETRVAL